MAPPTIPLYEAAAKGSLNESDLKEYLAANPKVIDEPAGAQKITPLAAAVWKGHTNVVQLLLKYKANPNALSQFERPPLYFATRYTKFSARYDIAKALIAAGANVNATFPKDKNETPLMYAAYQSADKALIRLLLDSGAKPDEVNSEGKKAVDLAKGDLKSAFWTKAELELHRGSLIDRIVSAVRWTFDTIKSGVIGATGGGRFRKLNPFGKKDAPAANELEQPHSLVELQTELATYSKDKGLDKFFPPGDKFLENLAERAATLEDDPKSFPLTPDNLKRLTMVSMYQPIIYCDDSGSMEAEIGKTGQSRWDAQNDIVKRIARIATKIVEQDHGAHLQFINASAANGKDLDQDGVDKELAAVKPYGGTMIGNSLESKILKPFINDQITDLKRPVLICILTDGAPNRGDKPLPDLILECKRNLLNHGYDSRSVKFMISQIGDAEEADAFLKGLQGEYMIKDMLYCTAQKMDSNYASLLENERELEQWLLKTLTAPIMDV